MNNKSNDQIQATETRKAWITLENGKKYYTRATVIDIIIAVLIPIIGVITGLIALMKKEYKRGWTIMAISLTLIAILVIRTT